MHTQQSLTAVFWFREYLKRSWMIATGKRKKKWLLKITREFFRETLDHQQPWCLSLEIHERSSKSVHKIEDGFVTLLQISNSRYKPYKKLQFHSLPSRQIKTFLILMYFVARQPRSFRSVLNPTRAHPCNVYQKRLQTSLTFAFHNPSPISWKA